ncbi:hypothetical protein SOHN41_03738 [Shewanella sp. HN-41]|nr:hypothetical protein SOHN41_03738 [Shewanella sp. HN-41]
MLPNGCKLTCDADAGLGITWDYVGRFRDRTHSKKHCP